MRPVGSCPGLAAYRHPHSNRHQRQCVFNITRMPEMFHTLAGMSPVREA